MSPQLPANRRSSVPDRVVWRHHNRDWHWSYNLMIAGPFLGFFSLAFAGHDTEVSHWFLGRLWIFCSLIGIVIPVKFYNRWWRFGVLEAILFNLFAVGPLLCGLLLWTNLLIHGPEDESVYQIENIMVSNGGFANNAKLEFLLADSALADYPAFRKIDFDPTETGLTLAREYRVVMAQGLFGYRVLIEAEPVIP